MLRACKFAACILFLAGLAFACYRSPVDNLDRYIYEAIVRGKSQPVEAVYAVVKHASPRAEQSSILDSPQHLQELEPMYAIRPVYLAVISGLSRGVPIQSAISLISAASLFGIGLVVLFWTQRPLLAGLLMAAIPILVLGRLGGPDALAAVLVISALWLVDSNIIVALGLLFLSLGARTDDILILFAVLVWLAWDRRLPRLVAGALAVAALGIVLGINHWAGNYGWVVLFRFSFVGGRYPAQIPHVLTAGEYVRGLWRGTYAIADQVAIWVLLGILAWRRSRDPLLIVAGCAVLAHFLLYPSGEDRYLIWAYVVAGVSLIRALDGDQAPKLTKNSAISI
ncbi:MAG: hypothetical protein ABSE44_19535 [Candidatus Sulfotelmatobacter sp.]